MTTPEPHSPNPENSTQESASHNALEAAGIDAAAMSYPHNPDFDNGRWFPTWRPYGGDLDRDPVGINEYLPPAKSVLSATVQPIHRSAPRTIPHSEPAPHPVM